MARSFRGYEIQKKIGAGGMSTLYLGIQKALNRQVALKMLHPGLADDESFIARFEREAQASSAIGHRNIVSVFDFGQEDDVYYIVMEFVQGMDLKDVLAKTKSIPPEIVLALLEEVAYGLEAAHAQGVIHRDIKPSNVMLSESGEVKIADFGLARQSSDIARLSALTLPGSVLGTPAYMSPEQAAGKDVDHRTDIYSLGVMAYELFTGKKPFAGSSYSEIRDQIINHEPPPLMGVAAVTSEVEALVHRMLAKDPDRRYPSIRHVIRAIEDCMETIDPTGGLIKYRRKYLTKFASSPEGFADELRKSSISAHLDRGFYFKKMGLAKIDDAVREFRYVLFLDPANLRAVDAIAELEREAEASGIRPPKGGQAAQAAATPQVAEAIPDSPIPSSRPAFLGNVDESLAPKPRDTTRVLKDTAVPDSGVTQILDGPARTPSGVRAKRAFPWVPVGSAVGVLVVALLAWQFWPSGGGDAPPATAAGAILVESQPAGASVFVKGPGEVEFRDTGQRTSATIADLAEGIWDVRVELAGHKTEARRVSVGEAQETLSLTLSPEASEGQIAITSEPSGATVRIRRLGETEYQTLAGVTPLTTDRLAAGAWEVELSHGSGRTVMQSVNVGSGQMAALALDLSVEPERPRLGRAHLTSEPAGAEIRGKGPGESEYRDLRLRTPATTPDLAVGSWMFRFDLDGYERAYRKAVLSDGQVEDVNVAMSETGAGTPVTGDGYVRVVIVPFADLYLNGRLFQNQARAALVPVAAGRGHTIELRHPAFGEQTFEVPQVAPGDTVDLGRFDFKWGDVRIYCRPAMPADILVDGEKLDRQTPYLGKLGSGRHRLALVKPGFRTTEVVISGPTGERRLTPNRSGEVDVEVRAGQEVGIQFMLERDG